MRLLSLALGVALLSPIDGLTAQEPPPIEPGARVRVEQCHAELRSNGRRRTVCERSVGTLSTLSANTLAVADGPGGLLFALDSVTSIEVSSGQKRQVVRGALIGFGVGVVAGVALGKSTDVCNPPSCYRVGPSDLPDPAAVGGVAGGLFGALVGVLVGTLIKTERWEEVPLDRLRVSFAPQRVGKFALGLSVSF
jgi:hypothetical protein